MKLRITKTLLWLLAGFGLTILLLRLVNGPGSVTALTDVIPWGLWKGGGVVALVALGGAGFTVAMFVYIFGWERYRPLVRGAVLLALLAYSSVGGGLAIDIGIWWRIVFPVFHWQIHSVLFEVAWCIMLYLVVLMGEFAHTAFERFGWKRAVAIMHKVTIVFVVIGIALSTLHQSSLGTLFLATPFRLHPLWYTDALPLLFFVSAMGVGCLTISLAALVVHWLHGAKPPMDAIGGLGRIAAWLLGAYLVIRFGEILLAGETALLWTGGVDTINFWIEIALSAALPLVLLTRASLRNSPRAMFWISLCATAGFVLNRVNVAGLGTLSLTHSLYWPAWTEWAITFGVLAAAGLVYLFVAERFALFEGIGETATTNAAAEPPADQGLAGLAFRGEAARIGGLRLYSSAFIFAMALSFGCASDDALFGVQPEAVAVARPRTVAVVEGPSVDGETRRLELASHEGPRRPAQSGQKMALLLDGNRDGRQVIFDHDGHAERLGDEAASCQQCHHMSRPLDDASSCGDCHQDMYAAVDIFDHQVHAHALGGNDGCDQCHTDPNLPKVRANTTACEKCHADMRAPESRISGGAAPSTMAAGYLDAMHGLCIDCHDEHEQSSPERRKLSECVTCHATMPRGNEELVMGAVARERQTRGQR